MARQNFEMAENLIDELSVLIMFLSSSAALVLLTISAALIVLWLYRKSRAYSWLISGLATSCFAASLLAAAPAVMISSMTFAFALNENQKEPVSDLCLLEPDAKKLAVSYTAEPKLFPTGLVLKALDQAELIQVAILSSERLNWIWSRVYSRIGSLAPGQAKSAFHLELPSSGVAMGSFSLQFAEKVVENEDQTPLGSFALGCRRADGSEFDLRPFSERIYDQNLLEHMTFALPETCLSGRDAEIIVTWEHRSDLLNAFAGAGLISSDILSAEWMVEAPLGGYLPRDDYRPGETIDFHLTSPTGKADLALRHVGLSTQTMFSQTGILAPPQRITPLAGRDGVDWPENFSFRIPQSWNPGYYQFQLTNENKTAEGYFVVSAAPDEKRKLVLVAATNTWQAYNSWGGQSLYRDSVGECIGMRNANRVSLNRPYLLGPSFSDQPTKYSHLAQAESLVGAWLDKMEVPFDVITDRQLHDMPAILNNYDVVMLPPHPEYWSNEMRGALEGHVGQGKSVIYLGGNGLYERVSIDGDEMEGYNHRQTHEHDNQIGGFFYLNDRPQSALLGVQYDSRGYITSEPYEVMAEDHWIYENTRLKNGDRFGTGVIAGERVGAAGLETDKRTDASPANTLLLARGDGESMAEMVIYDLPGGNFVFSAGSISFALTLNQDETQSKILENIVRRALED